MKVDLDYWEMITIQKSLEFVQAQNKKLNLTALIKRISDMAEYVSRQEI